MGEGEGDRYVHRVKEGQRCMVASLAFGDYSVFTVCTGLIVAVDYLVIYQLTSSVLHIVYVCYVCDIDSIPFFSCYLLTK